MVTKIGNSGNNTLIGTAEADLLKGKGGNDILKGKAGWDDLYGGKGHDTIYDGDGWDIVFGEGGNDYIFAAGDGASDTYDGGSGNDTVDYSLAPSAVTEVYLASGPNPGGAAINDTFVSIENVVGSRFADSLQPASNGFAFGGKGNDSVYGAFGNELLRGDQGQDYLDMSYGPGDVAWLQNGKGRDFLGGFVEGDDLFLISLKEFKFGKSFKSNELTNSNTGTAVGTRAQFIYDGDDMRLYWDKNGTDSGGRKLIAVFGDGVFAFTSITGGTLELNDFITIA